MGTTQNWRICPKCGKATFCVEHYNSEGEESCSCMHCGYTRNISFKCDANNHVVMRPIKIDLTEGNVFYAEAERDENGKYIFVKHMPVLPTDTVEDVHFFIDLHLCFYPFNAKELPEKFNMFGNPEDSQESWKDTQYNIFLKTDNEVKKLWFIGCGLKISNGILEILEPEYEVEEYGGFGAVILKTDKPVVISRSLEEGEIPEITDDVIFASAVIDGKLTVLKQNEVEKDND